MKTVVLSGGDAAKCASSILRRAPLNTIGPPPNRRCPDRRYTLIGDNANVVYAAVYNAGHVRCIGFMHSYLGEQELGQRWILASCEHAVRSDEELPPVAFAYQVESALTVNAIVDHN
jgi:hypothetical protein